MEFFTRSSFQSHYYVHSHNSSAQANWEKRYQQGVFELVTIIILGSAAGDPMFYKKVGLLPAILVFVTIVLMYKSLIIL